jgi:peroxiredoxin Q/BCP
MAGRDYLGVVRTTFVIGPDGTILHTFENVKPDGHDQEVLEWLAQTAQWSGPSGEAASHDFGRSHTDR